MSDQESTDDIEAKLKALQQQRLEACRAEIGQVLQKYKCALVGVPQYQQDNSGAWLTVVSVGVVNAPQER